MVHFQCRPDCAYTGSWDSPDQNTKGLSLEDVQSQDKTVRIESKKSKWLFEGTLQSDNNEIVGEFKQSGQSFPLVWK